MYKPNMRVYLADLRHTYSGVLANDCMPLGIGYMKAVMDRDLAQHGIESRLFAYPDRLLRAMKQAPPDVLMVTNYVWNERLSLQFARLAKSLRPGAVTVMGGPNIPLEPERQIKFVADRPELDVYVCGEGDFLAAELVDAYMQRGCTAKGLCDGELSSSVYRRASGEITRTETKPRHREVDEIPSPYLTGIMDEFFDGKLAPFIETNRGCPFRCTFCVQGSKYYTKVHYFEFDRICAEIDYIARMIQEHAPAMKILRIADSNYGMFERDVEISAHIGRVQAKYGWPTFIDATTGKNRPDRIIQSLERVNGAVVLYQAVQSLDEEVLRQVDRTNIKLDSYEQIALELQGRGLRQGTDLILGLPAETKDSHLKSLYSLIDAGAHQAHCFQAMMLKGSRLESKDSRGDYGFSSRFRVLPKSFGEYNGEKIFDVEEIVVATNTLSFEDYLTCRKHHFAFSVFWNDAWFSKPVEFAAKLGVTASTWLRRLVAELEKGRGPVPMLLQSFIEETRNELFESAETCIAFYNRQQNFNKLRRGEIGDNLMYKYRAIASFILWDEVCDFAMTVTRDLLLEEGADELVADFDTLWRDFTSYVKGAHASGLTADSLLAPFAVASHYDIHRWLAEDTPSDASAYKSNEQRHYVFELSSENAEELRAALKVWTSKATGLSKLVTRVRLTSQVRNPRLTSGLGRPGRAVSSEGHFGGGLAAPPS